jgi:hypothetical protein
MKHTTTTAIVFAALAATLMMFAVSVIMQQVDAAPPIKREHLCHNATHPPPCAPIKRAA